MVAVEAVRPQGEEQGECCMHASHTRLQTANHIFVQIVQ